jgi:hypothetical protein
MSAKNWGQSTLSQGAFHSKRNTRSWAPRGQSGLSPVFRPVHHTPSCRAANLGCSRLSVGFSSLRDA